MEIKFTVSTYSDQTEILISDATKEETQKVVDLFLLKKEEPRPQLKDMPAYRQQGLMRAIRFFRYSVDSEASNKISQIKFLRTICDLGLKDSKDLVEYALDSYPDENNVPKPGWLQPW